jgi:inorganic phosphate transporter, PiT family
MLSIIGGLFLGWSLGANDASNIFGTAVSSKMIKFWAAAILAAVFVILGAVVSGQAGIETLKGLTTLTLKQAVIVSIAAALTVSIMTILGLPVSTSQSVVGAIVGISILNRHLNLGGIEKVLICWFTTPIGAAIISVVLYHVISRIYNRLNINLFQSDTLIRACLIVSGSYGAYTLGANNVANVTAVFVSAELLNIFYGTLVGGISIAAGILTYSRPVMETVGKKLVRLDPFSALIVVFALALTMHIYTLIGVPVSSSQAVIGSVLGIGMVKGVNTVSTRTLRNILSGWFLTPIVSGILSLAIYFFSQLQFVSPAG